MRRLPAAENLTAMAAAVPADLLAPASATRSANMIAPTVKVCGNRNTVDSMRDNIDFDCSGIFENDATISEYGAN